MSDHTELQELMKADLGNFFPRTRDPAFFHCKEAFWELIGSVHLTCLSESRGEFVRNVGGAGLLPRRSDNDLAVTLFCPHMCGFEQTGGRELISILSHKYNLCLRSDNYQFYFF